MDRLHIKKPFMTYEEADLIANGISSSSEGLIRKEDPIGTTLFGYKINKYTIGNGPNHIVVYGATHGCELITTSFILEMLGEISQNRNEYMEFIKNNTLHVIPVLNPEGYEIASSAVNEVLKDKTLEETEEICREYYKAYKLDDEEAAKSLEENTQVKKEKLHRKFFEGITTDCIKNEELKKSVNKILEETELPPSVMATWSSNGIGVDLNASAPQAFSAVRAMKLKKQFTNNRYNDIPIFTNSPFNYVGEEPMSEEETPENVALYNFLKGLYSKKFETGKKEHLAGIFSYHSSGGEVYTGPDSKYEARKKQYGIFKISQYIFRFGRWI